LSVAAFLPTRLLTHIKHVFAEDTELFIARSWEELDAFIRRKPITAVILDPMADGIMNVGAVAGFLTRYPSLPLIAYVTLGAPAFGAVAQLGRLGLHEVILHRFDDAPERFRERVEQVRANPLARRVVGAIGPSLGQLTRQLAVTVENMFDQPHRYTSALDLAMEAKIPIVRLYRNLDVAELGSPKRLLIAAKVLRGFGYLRDPGYSVLDVSIKLGYRSTRIFSQHSVAVFGLTPARVRTRLSDEEAVESVLQWLRVTEDEPDSSGDRTIARRLRRRHGHQR
jgi:AraC-like DNA-binding protein